jgi:hypothetical protein
MLTISPQLLKRVFLSAALTTTMSTGLALAQATSPDPAMTAPTTSETKTMDNYLNNHPQVAKELHDNPSLINNPQWLASHPKVQSYMSTHPALKTDAVVHPDQFVNHTERQDAARDHKGLNSVDEFARDHPKVANELKDNPKLIDDPKFLANHPGLDSYLAKHPEIRQEAQAHPDAFANAAERNNRYNEAHEGHSTTKPAAAKSAAAPRPAAARK